MLKRGKQLRMPRALEDSFITAGGDHATVMSRIKAQINQWNFKWGRVVKGETPARREVTQLEPFLEATLLVAAVV